MRIDSALHLRVLALLWVAFGVSTSWDAVAERVAGMQSVGLFAIDRTEVTVGAFRRYIAATGVVTRAEREGGGLVYASGWQHKVGWTWHSPYGVAALDDEPVVHVTFDEAAAYCVWIGKRLPTDAEWTEAAYTERRKLPATGFVRGRTYAYPTGDSPHGANCLSDCGVGPKLDRSAVLERGHGHARAGSTKAGVNGLYEMAANVWEWTDNGDPLHKPTRGGSWWYGSRQMSRGHRASKRRDMAAVYIGFRCAQDRP